MVKAIEVVKTRLGEFDFAGSPAADRDRRSAIVPCSSVILAVGESVDTDFSRASGLRIKENAMLEVDRYTLATSREKFFAGGDLISGASNLSNAMGYGKKAAKNIDQYLTAEARFDSVMPSFVYDQKLPAEPSACRRHHAHELPAAIRAKTFQEAATALLPEEAYEKLCCCLRCDIRESGDYAVTHR